MQNTVAKVAPPGDPYMRMSSGARHLATAYHDLFPGSQFQAKQTKGWAHSVMLFYLPHSPHESFLGKEDSMPEHPATE